MDYKYGLFKIVFMSLKNYLDASRWVRDQRRRVPEGVVKSTFHYRNDLSTTHECNIYKPQHVEKTEDLPLIIDVHGGCWVHGDKDLNECFNYDLVLQGYTVSSLTYRTCDRVYLKDMVQDVFSYMHFLENCHEDLGIGLEDVMLTGDSAGAQLSLLVWAINQQPELQKLFEVEPVSFHVRCLCLTHPVCFLNTAATVPGNKYLTQIGREGLLRILFGEDWKNSEIYQAVHSPEQYLSRDLKMPPILVMTSQGDSCYRDQSIMLERMLSDLGADVSFYYEPDKKAVHVFNIDNPETSLARRFNGAILEFFDSVCKTLGGSGLRAA